MADQSRIFDRFERAVSERNYGGLGLGLFISREIAVAHGGSIRVESELKKGSTFTLTLPLEHVPQSSLFMERDHLNAISTGQIFNRRL